MLRNSTLLFIVLSVATLFIAWKCSAVLPVWAIVTLSVYGSFTLLHFSAFLYLHWDNIRHG